MTPVCGAYSGIKKIWCGSRGGTRRTSRRWRTHPGTVGNKFGFVRLAFAWFVGVSEEFGGFPQIRPCFLTYMFVYHRLSINVCAA